MTRMTIKFCAKRDEFAGGVGYKVPQLTASHVVYSDRDTLATLLSGTREYSTLLAQWRRYGVEIPGVIWEDNAPDQWRSDTSAWTITPRGTGFMADISATFELRRVSS
jgi:hypothetical protein